MSSKARSTPFILLVYFLFVSGSTLPKNKMKIVIDQDAGADDAMGILIATIYEKHFNGPEIVALTTAHGNVDEPQAFNNTMRILGVADRLDIPIYRGSKKAFIRDEPSDHFFGIDGLGDNDYGTDCGVIEAESDHAAVALLDLSREYEGELIVVTIGSLTNIAIAMNMDPSFLDRVAHLYIGAGNIKTTDSSWVEFNVLVDVESYYAALRNANPDKVTVIPFSQSPVITKDWRINVLGKLTSNYIEAMNAFESVSLQSNGDSWLRLDPLVLATVMNKSLVTETRYSNNSVTLCGEDRGMNTNVFSEDKANANVNLLISVDKEAYMSFLIEVFA